MSNPRSTTIRDQHRKAIRRTKPPCGICGDAIDYSLPHTDPRSFVVDHVVPVARGGPDTLDNKRAAHRDCNRAKSDKQERLVMLICGPPGAGKTTLAHESGLTVYDLDDAHWGGSDRLFRDALATVAQDDGARAAVIRSGATLSARQAAANLCRATTAVVLDVDLNVCVERIRERHRTTTAIKAQIAAAQDWWVKFEPGPVSLDGGPRTFVTPRSW